MGFRKNKAGDPSSDGPSDAPSHPPSHGSDASQHLKRRLGNRQIQLMAIGGSIGTALFVSIRNGLAAAGPANLLLGYLIYALLLACVNNSMGEMATLQPVAGGFVRMAGKWVDDAFGFMAGCNFFLYEALLIPFEITALSVVLKYWREDIPAAAVICVTIACYAGLNLLAVRAYGEAEFWLSGGKVFLIMLLFTFTVVTMCGGNGQHDAYGFRYWTQPGAFRGDTDLQRFQGFLAAIFSACFTVVGPEYLAMVAAEAEHPSVYMRDAFKTVYVRFGIFFILGALCVGVVVPYDDPALSDNSAAGSAAGSPYVIAMQHLHVRLLPDLTNALMLTSIFSAGNTYTYCATRSLYGLALEGRAPRALTYCTHRGVPLYCFLLVMCFPLLAFLQLGDGSDKVLTYLINLITGGGLINFLVMSLTYLCFYRACRAQGVDRRSFPYYGYLQPWCGLAGVVGLTLCIVFIGYRSISPFRPNEFLYSYMMPILALVLLCVWKLLHRTRFVRPLEADLVWERPAVLAYEAGLLEPPKGFWEEMRDILPSAGRGCRAAAIP